MSLDALPPGTRLKDFEIIRGLGFGGFGITYLGYDHVLEQGVAIKEYFPADFARRLENGEVVAKSAKTEEEFNWGLARFLDEAKIMAKLRHPNLVRANRYFPMNGTGYIVMDYIEGDPLSVIYKREGRLPAQQVRHVLESIADGLKEAHRFKIYHRDIKPSNILIDSETGQPVLIDFGAARQAVQTRSAPITTIVTAPYAPYEQYTSQAHRQGPWTDIYSLSVVGYQGLTGALPPDGPGRLDEDTHIPLDETRYDDRDLCRAINAGMQVRSIDRPGELSQWLTIMGGGDFAAPGPSDSTTVDDGRTWKRTPDDGGGQDVDFADVDSPAPSPAIPFWVKVAVPLAVLLIAGSLSIPFLLNNDPVSDPPVRVATDNIGANGETSNPTPAVETSAAPPQRWQDSALAPVMVRIPAGSFEMGTSPNEPGHLASESPKRIVTFSAPFAISETEVTIGDWAKCIAAKTGGCRPLKTATKSGDPANASDGVGVIDERTKSLPVRYVALSEINQYLAWLTRETGQIYRLPSEAEWEYAARAGQQTSYVWGDQTRTGAANCRECGTGLATPQVQPVKTYDPNAFGLYDMAGNVFELVEDCWTKNFSSAPTNGASSMTGDCSWRTIRGGDYLGALDDLRVARRSGFQVSGPGSGNEGVNIRLGFRVARDVKS